MTFQEQQNLIRTWSRRLMQGGKWADFQHRLMDTPGLYRRERENVSLKVLLVVEKKYGPEIARQLNLNPELLRNPGLDPVVFGKLQKRQQTAIENRLVNAMARDLQKGISANLTYAGHQHPLLRKSHLVKAKGKIASQQRNQKVDRDFDAHIAFKVVLAIIKLILGLSAFS